MHRMKTGALIRASIRLGAAAAGRSMADEVGALDAYAAAAGLAFQVIDDVLDVEGSAASLGKTAGKDRGAGQADVRHVPRSRGGTGARGALRTEARAALAPFGGSRDAGSPSSPTGSCCGRH